MVALLCPLGLMCANPTISTLDSNGIYLALRRTADAILRQAGDSLSRIEVTASPNTRLWQIRLNTGFRYEQLPFHLEEAFHLYQISNPYHVAIRRCEDDRIDLGFHKSDYTEGKSLPCEGREITEACRYIEIEFVDSPKENPFYSLLIILALFGLGGLFFWKFRMRSMSTKHQMLNQGEDPFIPLGQSKLYPEKLTFVSNAKMQTLTYRECKLLQLFAAHTDNLLSREYILQQIWEDEGVQVSRSLDVFISRLRKKIQIDPNLSIMAVHGLGYKLLTQNHN